MWSILKWTIPVFLFFLAVVGHLATTPTLPIEEEIEEEIATVFGGVLSNEVVATTTVEVTNSATEISSPGLVWVSDTNGYIFYEAADGGLWMSSTTDSGATWSTGRRVDSVNTTDVVTYGVWWEGWTPGTTTTRYIHVVSVDLGVDDTYYTRVDTQTGAISTTVLGTTQTASCTDGSACYTSITMTATGTLLMMNQQTSDSWVVRCGQYNDCTNAANWHELTGAGIPGVTNNYPILLPIPGTDNFMWISTHISFSDILFRVYSATSSSWFGTASSSLAKNVFNNTTYDAQLLGATLSTTTGLLYFATVDDADEYTNSDHDVNIWSFSTTTWAWTQKTNCVQNYGGIIGAKIAWDEANDTLYCIYGARTTIGTNTTGGIYYKTSTDGGTTWSATSSMVNDNADDINGMTVNIIGDQRIGVTWNYTTAPRADQQFYDDIADLIADIVVGGSAPAGGIIWYE